MRLPLIPGSLWVIVLVAACSNGITTGGEASVNAALRGTVMRQDGSPVPETRITVIIYDHPECSGQTTYGFPKTRSTSVSESGAFEADYSFLLFPPFSGCLEVTADPPDTTGLASEMTSGIGLDFRLSPPWDTATVDFVLEPK